MPYKWTDVQQIAEILFDEFPDQDPQYIRFTDLHEKICKLDFCAKNNQKYQLNV